MSQIQMNGVSKRFQETQALRQVSLCLEENKIYGLLGRNGAGKSTLLNILTNRIFPDAGEIQIDGEPVDASQKRLYLAGEQNLFPEDMTVEKALRWTKEFYPDYDRAYAKELCKKFWLDPKKKIKGLSTGYSSIFQNILALSVNVPYLFFDEPVLGLDANHRELFYRTVIEKYSQSPCTILLSTHLIEEAANLIEEVIILKEGEVICQEPKDQLLARGYTVSGSTAKVDAFLEGKQCLGFDQIGGLKSAYLLGSPEGETDREGLEFSQMDLQKLFIQMTNA